MDFVQQEHAGNTPAHAHKRTTAFEFWLRRQSWSFLYWHSMLLMAGFWLGILAVFTIPLGVIPPLAFVSFLTGFLCYVSLAAFAITSPFAFGIALMKKYAPSVWVAGFAMASIFFIWLFALLSDHNHAFGLFLFIAYFLIGGVCALASAASVLRDIPRTLKEPDTLGCLTAHTTNVEATHA